MVDTYLASDNVTVLGGPSEISVDVDFGPAGDRGSNFFVGNGNPNIPTTVIGQTPQIFDMYINIAGASDEDSLYLFQYQNVDGTNVWTKLIKLIPNTYSTNSTGTFTNGERLINIPIANVVPSEIIGSVTSSNFNVQHSVLGTLPVASSISIDTLDTDSESNIILPITVYANEFDGSSWTALTGSRTVHLLITVV